MHILVVNDDGPPSNQSSPYVHSLISTLQTAGHIVSVVLPHVQRSWIGKAHIVGQTVKPTYFRPGTLHQDDGTTHQRPLPASSEGEEWVLVDGTPASCVQIGLFHVFQDRGPVDLVISGPNYGRNSTAIFSLSSGTIGGAMEAAICGKRAIALSYAFFSRDHDSDMIAGASRLSVKLVEHLYNHWGKDVDLYSINVPLIKDVEQHKILYTHMLQNYWSSGSSFQEVLADEEESEDPEGQEQQIRQGGDVVRDGSKEARASRHTHKHFKWAPRFTDVHKSVEQSGPGNDGWAIKEGYTSVTPLKANFMHASSGLEGELKLTRKSALDTNVSVKSSYILTPQFPSVTDLQSLSLKGGGPIEQPKLYILVDYEDDYVQPLILKALQSRLPPSSYVLVSNLAELPEPSSPILEITSYERLDFEHLLSHPTSSLANAYIIRKALIRKHYLSNTVANWITKHPASVLKHHVKAAVDFELDYAEFLDEALVEAYELHESWTRNESAEGLDREWWILKPSMSDRGQGIKLFSSEEELRNIFEKWEAEQPDSDSDCDAESDNPAAINVKVPDTTNASNGHGTTNKDYMITSQLRHFIAQRYIHPPLLLSCSQDRKFHIRTYVLAVGSLRVYVYREMLALFAADPYTAPAAQPAQAINLNAHLTNTCLQTDLPGTKPTTSVRRFWSLDDDISFRYPRPKNTSGPNTSQIEKHNWKESVYAQIRAITSETFQAAARENMIHFQTLPNAFEVFGVDFMVDGGGNVWLLEVNAFPDFKQSGEKEEMKDGVVGGLWKSVVDVAILPFFEGLDLEVREGRAGGAVDDSSKLEMVLDLDLGRR